MNIRIIGSPDEIKRDLPRIRAVLGDHLITGPHSASRETSSPPGSVQYIIVTNLKPSS